MKLPRWDCRNDEDRRLLEEWTLDQLDKLDNELVTERDIEIMVLMNRDEFARGQKSNCGGSNNVLVLLKRRKRRTRDCSSA